MSELEFWKDLGNIFDAVLDYQRKNVEFNNRFINPWIRLGNVFDRKDQTNDAVQAYRRATEIDPDTAQNWADLGDAQFKKGDVDDAIEAYRKAVTIDPEAGWPLGNLALSLVTQGHVEQAIPIYKKSIDLLIEVKDKAICWNRLGNAYRKLNDYENAFQAFQAADQLDGENTGFNDKLDEALPNTSVVAPEEILDQMVVEQTMEAEPTPPEPVSASTDEVTQPEAESSVTAMAEGMPDEIVALAPNMEMIVEEEITQPLEEIHVEDAIVENVAAEEAPILETVSETFTEETAEPEKAFDILQVVEDVIAKVELSYAEQEVSEADEVQAVEDIPVNEALAQEVETPLLSEETVQSVETIAQAIVEEAAPEVQEVEAVAQPVEETALEAELPALSEEPAPIIESAEESHRIPAWLTFKGLFKSGEKEVNAEAEAQVESVATISEIPQESAVSESAVNMDVVETFTDTLAVQLTTEPTISEEPLSESAEQVEVKNEAEVEEQEAAAVEESNPVEESALAEETSAVVEESAPISVEEKAAQFAYEEYLKDTAESRPIHSDTLQSEAPLTKVSSNGELRIAMDTKNAHVWNELGNIYLNANACEDAIASYSKAIELDGHFAWPYSNLALAYVQKGRFAEAILLYQRGIELFTSDKDKAITWNRLGNVYRRMNDYNNAIAAYQTADELDPENATLSLRSSFGLLGNMFSEAKPALVV